MIAIVCLDEQRGMLFNKRRQSRDRRVTERILEITEGKKLWMEPFSVKLFEEMLPENAVADEDFLLKAEKGEYCFVENRPLKALEGNIEKLIVFWWNRRYPTDFYLDLELNEWILAAKSEFAGYSHEKITEMIYQRA